MGENKKKKELLGKYWAFIRPYRFVILGILFLGILQLTAPLTIPWMTKILVDDVLTTAAEVPMTGGEASDNESGWTLKHVVLVMGGALLFSVIVQFVRNLITASLGSKMVVDIRRQLYEHLQKLSPKFYDNRPVGGVVSRVLNDVNGAQNLVGHGVINVFVDLFVVVFASYFIFLLDWRLALIALWILPIRADQILVMDQGQIVERGSHEKLLRSGGVYRNLYEKQLKAMRPEELEKAKQMMGS